MGKFFVKPLSPTQKELLKLARRGIKVRRILWPKKNIFTQDSKHEVAMVLVTLSQKSSTL